jgi:hypothetical protein
MELLEKIHDQAFASPLGLPLNLQGWIDRGNLMKYFSEAWSRTGPAPIVIEVGSWRGLSACNFAKHMSNNGAKGRLVCIDTWLGSPEHQLMEELGPRDLGVPQIYREFLSNIQNMQATPYVYPFPISSTQGGHFLERKDVRADIVYIDAGHEFEAVSLDLAIFYRIVKPGGTVILDDYTWDGVRKAVHEFSEKTGVPLDISGNVVCIRKPI